MFYGHEVDYAKLTMGYGLGFDYAKGWLWGLWNGHEVNYAKVENGYGLGLD